MSTEHTWTLGSLLDWTAKHLALKGLESPRLDAEVLLAQAAGCKRIDLYGMRFAEEASPQVRQAYKELIRKRLEGCPVAYLVGRKEFYGLELIVSPAVLIPRPDSEHLVMEGLALAKKIGTPRILDIGTGSGNLVVALAKQLPAAQLTAVDVSADALGIAQQNAEKHGVADRIRFVQGDLFAALPVGEKFDVIVSNPPYIPAGDIPKLAPGVRDYEPHVALNGGTDGFQIFDRLVADARKYLVSGGHLLIEIGSPQEKPARAKIAGYAEYELSPSVFDFSGHPRVLKARLH